MTNTRGWTIGAVSALVAGGLYFAVMDKHKRQVVPTPRNFSNLRKTS